MGYEKQVSRAHYDGKAYRSPERWMSYWHQLETVRATKAREVLEIGLGEGVVARELTHRGVSVVTLDIAEDLKPDIVGSVTAMPIADRAYDAVLAAEILEHIRFEDVGTALAEIARLPGRHLYFLDDHLLGDRRFARALVDGMRGMNRLFQAAATVDSAG